MPIIAFTAQGQRNFDNTAIGKLNIRSFFMVNSKISNKI